MTPTFKGGYAIATAIVANVPADMSPWIQGGALGLLGLLLWQQAADRREERKWKAEREDKQHEFFLSLMEKSKEK